MSDFLGSVSADGGQDCILYPRWRTGHVQPPADVRVRWGSFAFVCLAYLVATTGEQLLSPLFPTAAADLGLGVGQGGIVFGVLTGSIAVFNLVGGVLLRRMSPGTMIRASAALIGVAGSVTTATTHSFVHAHRRPGGARRQRRPVLPGRPAGGRAARPGPRSKGFAMGIYGVAFSGGLTLAAVLGAVGSSHDWRIAVLGRGRPGRACCRSAAPDMPGPKPIRGSHSGSRSARSWRCRPRSARVLAVCQYGAIPFLTTFAVDRWGLSAASAATVLIVGRVISIVAKVDRWRQRRPRGRHAPAPGAPACVLTLDRSGVGAAARVDGHLWTRRAVRRHGQLARARSPTCSPSSDSATTAWRSAPTARCRSRWVPRPARSSVWPAKRSVCDPRWRSPRSVPLALLWICREGPRPAPVARLSRLTRRARGPPCAGRRQPLHGSSPRGTRTTCCADLQPHRGASIDPAGTADRSASRSSAAKPASMRRPSSSGSHSQIGEATRTPGSRHRPATMRARVCAFHGIWFAPPGVPPMKRGRPSTSATAHACSVVAGRRPATGKLGWPTRRA